MSEKLGRLVEEMESQIRGGDIMAARQTLKQIRNIRKLSRYYLPRIANMCRRVGHIQYSIRILYPYVYPKNQFSHEAKDNEKIEYAASLIRLGCLKESLKILETVDTIANPSANLFRAFACFAQWDYQASIAPLEKYCSDKSLGEFQLNTGKLNLGTAYIYVERMPEAIKILEEVIQYSKENQFSQMECIAKLLVSEAFIALDLHDHALENLNEGVVLSEKFSKPLYLNYKKWTVYALAKKEGTELNKSKLEKIKEEAMKYFLWEIARNCDELICREKPQSEKLLHLIAGSESESLKTKYIKLWQNNLPETYILSLGNGQKVEGLLDLVQIHWKGHELEKNQWTLPLNVIKAFLNDFYKRPNLIDIHQKVYPGMIFNPTSSIGLMHVALTRTRQFLKDNNIPLEIIQEDKFYYLKATKKIQIKLPVENFNFAEKEVAMLEEAKKLFRQHSFNSSLFSKELGVSLRSTNRYLKQYVESGDIRKTGKGKSTRYQFVI